MDRIDRIEQQIDLRRADVDIEMFAAALAVQHIRMLIANGGSSYGRPGLDSALHPQYLEAFLARAVESAQQTHRFEEERLILQRIFPPMRKNLFQQQFAAAQDDQEQMDYLSLIDFASECFVDSRARQAWLINGYMIAWREQFLTDEEHDE